MDQNIIKLFQKYLNRQCESGELNQVINIIERGQNEAEWEFVLSNDLQEQLHKNVEAEMSDMEVENVQRRIYNTIDSEPGKIVSLSNYPKLWPRFAVAASIVFVLGFGGYFYFKQPQKTEQTQLAKKDITPGKNTATLTLANGQRIFLSEAVKGQLAKQAGSIITKTGNGQIDYRAENTNEANVDMNLLSTARGEQYQVVLPDGSHVWLNSASSLKYPASFASAKERKVELTGEAYFEIAKDKEHPFIVNFNKQDVKVLGTHFDINSYSDEPSTKTTLLEGSIQLNNSTILKPGEQADLSPEGNVAVYEVNASKFIAWKNGKFVFEDENIQSVMRKLSRWYNVDVIYDGNVSDRTFTGSISRFDNISKILDKITYTQTVHFKIEGRRITVIR